MVFNSCCGNEDMIQSEKKPTDFGSRMIEMTVQNSPDLTGEVAKFNTRLFVLRGDDGSNDPIPSRGPRAATATSKTPLPPAASGTKHSNSQPHLVKSNE
jgi:hypothetical protein